MNGVNHDHNASALIWERVSSGDEKIPRLKSSDAGDDASGYSSNTSGGGGSRSSVESSPEEVEKRKAEKRPKRTRKKSAKKSASKSAQARSILWCKEHFENETPSAEGQSTHFTKDAVYRASKSEGKAGAAGEDEPTPGPSRLAAGASGHSTDGEGGKGGDDGPSKSGHRKKRKRRKKGKQQRPSRRSRRGGAANGDAWPRRSSRHRGRRRGAETQCDYDSDDSVESSPERYREAKFKVNGHILRKKPWLSLERRKSTENK